MIGLLLAVSLSVRADPPQLLLSGAATAEISVAGAPDGARIELWASAGTLGEPRRAPDGTYRASYRAPRQRFPRVTLVLATVREGTAEERAWLALPLVSSDVLSLATKPSSHVEVTIAGTTFGPVRADRAGNARVRVRAPPGFRTARVHVRDPYGNVSETAFDLRPPPFQRLRLLASAAEASWADANPVELEIFAVAADGKPAALADLLVAADRGRLGTPEERAPGVFRLAFRAPDVAGGAATVRAKLSHDGGPAQVASIALRAGAPASLRLLRPSPPGIVGAGEVILRAEVLDSRGNAVADQPVAFSTDYGELEASGPTARLRIPAAHEGRRVARVQARAAAAAGAVEIELRPGPPARATVQLARAEVRERQEVEATVQLSDAAGNPVEGAALEIDAERARAEPAREVREGVYSVRVRVGDAPGPAHLVVRSGAAMGRARLGVIPDERTDGIAIGGLVWGQSNLSRAWGGAAAVEVSVHPGLRPIELVARAGLLQFAVARSPLAGSDAVGRGDLRGLSLAVGARASVALLGRWALHATLSGGALRTFGTLSVEGSGAAGVRQGTAQWGPLGALAAGTTLRIGPGRAIAELQYTAAPGRGDLSGNLGGFTVCAGYLFALR